MADTMKGALKTRRDGPTQGEPVVLGTPFSSQCRAIWVGVAGHLNVTLSGQATLVEYKNVPVGRFVISATMVTTTTGTATELIAEW